MQSILQPSDATTITFFADLVSKERCMACVQGAKVLSFVPIPEKVNEDLLMPLFDRTLKEAEIARESIGRIAAIIGPGGFMSLRVGIAFANALQYGLDVPLGGIRLLEMWKLRVKKMEPQPLWLHATKRELLFFCDFEKHEEPSLLSISELSAKYVASRSYVGEVLPEQAATLPQFSPLQNIPALQEILPSIVSTITYKKRSLLPWYGRGA